MKNYMVFWTDNYRDLHSIGERNRCIEYEKILEEWVENYTRDILGDDIIIIARQYKLSSDHRIDLLGIDSEGNTVIIELKRANAPSDVLTQTLSYAEEIRELTVNEILKIYRDYAYSKQLQNKTLNAAVANRFGTELKDARLNNKQIIIIVAFEFGEKDIRAARYLTSRGTTVKLVELVGVPLENKLVVISTQLVRYDTTDHSSYNEQHHISRIKNNEVKEIYRNLLNLFSNYKCGLKHTQIYTSAKFNSYTIVRCKLKPTTVSYITVFCSYRKSEDIGYARELAAKTKNIKLEFEKIDAKHPGSIKSIKFSSINSMAKYNKILPHIEKALKNRIDFEKHKDAF